MKINIFFVRDVRVVAAVQLKWCVAVASIFCIIIGELSHWKELCLVVLLEFDEDTEISFYCAVLPLGLAVSLRVEGCGKSLFDSEEVTK